MWFSVQMLPIALRADGSAGFHTDCINSNFPMFLCVMAHSKLTISVDLGLHRASQARINMVESDVFETAEDECFVCAFPANFLAVFHGTNFRPVDKVLNRTKTTFQNLGFVSTAHRRIF